ncbi:hypothetical protein C8Q78DRAFT_992803 [Trametes maxima]|nr:hypothetical protein C8Q78DRAFT_992803 [Trametes maxima]
MAVTLDPPPPYDLAKDGEPEPQPGRNDVPPATSPHTDNPALTVAKGLGTIVAVPLVVAGVGVAAVGATIWGAAKVLEGVARGLTAGPEAVAKAVAAKWCADAPPQTRDSGEEPGNSFDDVRLGRNMQRSRVILRRYALARLHSLLQ